MEKFANPVKPLPTSSTPARPLPSAKRTATEIPGKHSSKGESVASKTSTVPSKEAALRFQAINTNLPAAIASPAQIPSPQTKAVDAGGTTESPVPDADADLFTQSPAGGLQISAAEPARPAAAAKTPAKDTKGSGEGQTKSAVSVTASASPAPILLNPPPMIEIRVAPARAQENADSQEPRVPSRGVDTADTMQSSQALPASAFVHKAESNPTADVNAQQNIENSEMAFAARIRPVEGQSQQSTDVPQHRTGNDSNDSLPAPRHSAVESGHEAAATETVASTPNLSASGAIIAQNFQIQPFRIATNDSVTATTTPKAAEPLAAEEAVAPKPAATSISVQVGSANGEVVEVRLSERSGELRVAVRTPDSDIAQGLRQGLSDLTTKLSENGYRTDTWHPADSAALTFSAAKDADNSQGQSSGGSSQQQSQQGSQQNDSGRQNQSPSNRPRWVQEIEMSLHGGQQTSGEFNGFIR